jgi:uncharacterized metal-binding protein YceD (DUF177 family)
MTTPSILKRRVEAASLPATGIDVSVEATENQRAALAGAYKLVAVNGLSATATVTPGRRGSLVVEGHVTADIVQSCVVSLESVAQHIDESFSIRFVPADSQEAALPKPGAEVVVDPTQPDPPEIMEGSGIDVGALVEEIFALAIDPYPRAPDAALPADLVEPPQERKTSPFAVLARVPPGKG